MSDGACLSETASRETVRLLEPVRVRGGISARFRKAPDGVTRLADLAEGGGYRMRFPSTHDSHIEATQVNTGGGVVGGDRIGFSVAVEAGAEAVMSTQAAERIYRSLGPAAEIDIALAVAADARLDWLPQETILFSEARLKRRFEIDIATTGRLLLAECITFGRIASGEVMATGLLQDVWRVRRDGRLLFAEAMRLDGDLRTLLSRPALANGGTAVGILLAVAPDAEDRLEAVRGALADAGSICAASAWNGMLTARFLAEKPEHMRRDVMRVTELLSGRPMPRVWYT
jgi:urease accessory protein